jgi:hypothetical protein
LAYPKTNNLNNPLEPVPKSTYILFPTLESVSTWMADLVLLLRLYAVFPYRATGRGKFSAVFAFPVLIKTARICTISTSVALSARALLNVDNPLLFATSNFGIASSPLVKAEYAFEIADHT